MQRKVKISPNNHIRFVPMDAKMAPQYNSLPFDFTWFSEQIRPWEQRVNFEQPIEKGDKLDIQIWTTQTFLPELKLYDCKGQLLSTDLFQYESYVPVINEDGFTYYVHRIKDATFFAALEPDNYTLVITVPFESVVGEGVDSYRNFISEPLAVRTKHTGTLLVETSHSTNKDAVVFKQTKQKFRLRVPAAIIDYQAKVDRTVFTDQRANSKQTSAIAYRGMKFCAGGDSKPIPDYFIFLLNHAFTCDSIIIDGKAYATVEGSAFEKDTTDAFPLYAATIEIGDKDNSEIYVYTEGGIPIIEQIPAYPFVINDFGIGYINNYDYSYGLPTRFANDTQLNAYIAARNANILQNNMEGEIVRQGDSIVYNKAVGENYNYAYAKVLVNRLGVKCTTTGVASIPVTFQMGGGTTDALYAVFSPTFGVMGWGNAPANFPFSYNFTYNVGGAGTYTYEIWHESTIAALYIYGASVSGIDKFGIASSLPPLAYFGIDNSTKLTSFSLFGQLPELRETLVAYRLKNNANLTDTGVYYPIGAWSTHGWRKLIAIVLQGNKLNNAMIDQWFNSMRSAMQAPEGTGVQFYNTGGLVWINAQTPSATATAASSIARNELTNTWGWSIVY